MSLELEVACDECGAVAAKFTLEKDGVHLKNFEWSGSAKLSETDLAGLRCAVETRDWHALSRLRWQFVVFWCRECDRSYCGAHWQIEDVKNDPMCSAWGTCPHGHGKIIDD